MSIKGSTSYNTNKNVEKRTVWNGLKMKTILWKNSVIISRIQINDFQFYL